MSPSSARAGWSYTVSVRSLCEFTAKRGSLDRRFTPSATATEGLAGQAAVASRRGPQYETEVTLATRVDGLRVRGRADGHDGRTGCLEEIKTIRGAPDDIPENRRQLHWAQLQTYGALFCRERGVDEVHLALVYVDATTQTETVLRELCAAADLEATFLARCQAFLGWARQEASHRVRRDAALTDLPFPLPGFRPGQRELAEAVYRAAVKGRCLLAQAPTGIGKTLGVLYPMLRAMPGQRLDKIGYLTCKGTGRATALEALQMLRETAPGPELRVLTLVAKDQACLHPGKACHGDACPLAHGFYDRLPAARQDAVQAAWLDPAAQQDIARRHGVCPYYLGQELVRWADVVVADVHHAFDPNGQLFGLAQSQDWRLGLLVDEAHNLIDRTRQMYSAAMTLSRVQAAERLAPAALRSRFGRLQRALNDLLDAQADDYAAHAEVPDKLSEALQALNIAVAEHFQTQPLATGALLQFHFDALRWQRLIDRFAAHSLFDVQRVGMLSDAGGTATEDDAVFQVRSVIPGAHLKARFAAIHSTTLFSATLGTAAYQRDLLGLPDDTAWIDVPPAFPPEHLTIRVAERLSTRYPHRDASLDALVRLIADQFNAHPGNYLAFFSSFDYADKAAALLSARWPQVPQWRQSRAMDDTARADFLGRFRREGRGIAFAVLGGAFAEGVDLPGSRLIGVFIATLGLPPVTPVQTEVRARLDLLFGTGHGYADLVPSLQKVVQAAGRVIRSPTDRGWLWLLDDRYGRPDVRALLPRWWRLEHGLDGADQ